MLYGSDKTAEGSGAREAAESGFDSDSAFEDLSNLKPVPQSPWRLFDSLESCEDKENHLAHPKVRENPQADQSYSHILSALGSDQSSPAHSPSKAFYPPVGRQRSLYGRKEQGESGEEEGGNTMQDSLLEAQIFEALHPSEPSSKCQPSPSSNPTLTSPYGHTTDHSDHIEIDLFDSILAEPSDDPCDLSLPSLGATPTKAFCPACQKQVVTLVTYCQPRLPVYALFRWEKLCELGSWMQCCKKLEKGQDVLHECRRCGRLLARVSTN